MVPIEGGLQLITSSIPHCACPLVSTSQRSSNTSGHSVPFQEHLCGHTLPVSTGQRLGISSLSHLPDLGLHFFLPSLGLKSLPLAYSHHALHPVERGPLRSGSLS